MPEESEMIIHEVKSWKCPGCGTLYGSYPEAELCRRKHLWPKLLEVEISQSKESAWQNVDKLNYPDELANKVMYALLSINVIYRFYENGDVKIVEVEGTPVDGKVFHTGEW